MMVKFDRPTYNDKIMMITIMMIMMIDTPVLNKYKIMMAMMIDSLVPDRYMMKMIIDTPGLDNYMMIMMMITIDTPVLNNYRGDDNDDND